MVFASHAWHFACMTNLARLSPPSLLFLTVVLSAHSDILLSPTRELLNRLTTYFVVPTKASVPPVATLLVNTPPTTRHNYSAVSTCTLWTVPATTKVPARSTRATRAGNSTVGLQLSIVVLRHFERLCRAMEMTPNFSNEPTHS